MGTVEERPRNDVEWWWRRLFDEARWPCPDYQACGKSWARYPGAEAFRRHVEDCHT